jgi:uncharacterized protein (TIGR03118 family)
MVHKHKQINLISDNNTTIPAENEDPNLQNAWGIVAEGNTTWISLNGTGFVGEYGKHDTKYLNVPTGGDTGSGNPSGLIINKSYGFAVTNGSNTARSKLLVATENGVIAGFNPSLDEFNFFPVGGINGSNAVYKGIAQLGNRIYVTDFHNARVDAFDSAYNPILTGKFIDTATPVIPTGPTGGYAPFGIAAIHNKLYVSYAKQLNPDNHDDQAGAGNGFVSIFDADGNFIKRLISNGPLNSPWGMVHDGDRLLVGNFGDGAINAFTMDGVFIHDIVNPNIDGLWGLLLEGNKLYFTAGPNSEADGLFGYIEMN